MSNQNIHIRGNAQGNAMGDGSTVINKDSFNTLQPELIELLQTLQQEFEKLPKEAANSVKPYIESIENEAKKEKPNKGFLEVTRKGLTDAAKTCADMMPSLLTAAGAVVDWISK